MRIRMIIALVIVVSSVTIPPAVAAIPGLLNLQGKLTDASGNPFPDASYTVTFLLYDNAGPGGTVLWSEVSSVTTADGLFTTNLGAVSPVPDSVFNNPDRWLGIQIQGYPEMSPRTRLTSVAYANETANWNSNGQNIYRQNGSIGIGTTNPIQRLHIAGLSLGDGIILVGSSPGYSLQAGGGAAFGEASSAGLWSQSADSGDAVVRSRSGGKLHLQSGFGAAGISLGSNGNVGVGFSSAVTDKLSVNGSIWAQSGISAFGSIYSYAGVIAVGDMWASNVYDQQTSCSVVWSCASDIRLKENIEPLQNPVDEIFKLSAVSFDWRRDEFPERQFPEGKQIGLIAQEVQVVVPEAVQENKDGYLSVDYARLVPLLVGSIKEQQQMLTDQQKRIEKLEETIRRMQP